MADGAFSSIGGLPSANIFWIHRLISLAADIGFKCQLDLAWPLFGIVREEKEMQTFSSTSWRRSTSTGRISLRHRFAQQHNQSKSFIKKSDLHTPPSWCATDDMTNTKTITSVWNLQCTTKTFGDNNYATAYYNSLIRSLS